MLLNEAHVNIILLAVIYHMEYISGDTQILLRWLVYVLHVS